MARAEHQARGVQGHFTEEMAAVGAFMWAITECDDEIEWAIKRDQPDVMNLCAATNALEENSHLVLVLSSILPLHLCAAQAKFARGKEKKLTSFEFFEQCADTN